VELALAFSPSLCVEGFSGALKAQNRPCTGWRLWYVLSMRGLYVIVDPDQCRGRDPRWVADRVLWGGCAALQLRAKTMPDRARLSLARALRERTHERGVEFWINDRADIALLAEADGLHLGQEDLPIPEARRLLGPKVRIGCSTHSLAQAQVAMREGADVLGFGPIFPTQSKPNPDPEVGLGGLREVVAKIARPIVAIGGIQLAHAADITRSGAAYAAVISAVCGAEDPGQAARELHEALLS
jgi:thiamine-phosphate pyrophosphorylase